MPLFRAMETYMHTQITGQSRRPDTKDKLFVTTAKKMQKLYFASRVISNSTRILFVKKISQEGMSLKPDILYTFSTNHYNLVSSRIVVSRVFHLTIVVSVRL